MVGAIRAESLVVSRVPEALLGASAAKDSSIERRLERFVSNDRIKSEQRWNALLAPVLPFFRQHPMRLVLDLTAYEEHAQVSAIGLFQQSRVLPLAWKVMPGQQKWDQGLWECVEDLLARLAPHLGQTDCPVIAESACGCFAMGSLCQQ